MFYNPAASPAPLHHPHHPHKLFQPDSQGNNGAGGGGGGGWRPPGNNGAGSGANGGHAQQPSFGTAAGGFGNLGHQQQQQQQQQGNLLGGPGFGGGINGGAHHSMGGGGGGNAAQAFMGGSAFGAGSGLAPGAGVVHHGQHGPHGMGGSHQGQLMQQGGVQGMQGQGHGGGNQSVGGQQHGQQQGLLQALNGNSPPGMRLGVGGGHGMGGGMMGQVQQEVAGPYWEQQIIRAQACRQASTPHHRAKASAIASRAVTQTTSKALPILDPNRPITQIASTPSLLHRKAGTNGITIVEDDRTDTSSPGFKYAHPSSLSVPATAPGETQEPELCMGLDLGGIKLRTLSPSLFAFSHVTALYINHNQLTSLSPAISHMRALTHLDVTGNLLTAIPPELGLLSHLKELLLFDNQLQDLPLELGTLHQLEFLGIEGNPLSDSIRHAMAERGTQGLIAYFRDNCPAPPPPPPRKWEIIQQVENDNADVVDGSVDHSQADQDTFSVLSFNILCERYATHTMYGYTPQWALNWDHRKDEILKQILESGAHIVCLQEVDDEQYHDFFLPNLEQRGFDGAFNPKTRARTMSTDERRRVDGCATFWKTSKYALIERQVIEFNQVALGKAEMRTEDMFNRVMSKDNISVACLLESTTTDSRLVVANAHIHWDPQYRDVKIVQVAMLIEEIEKLREQFARFPPKPPKDGDTKRPFSRYQDPSHISAIICGDFNSVPHSAVYNFLSDGTLAADHEDFMIHQYGHYTNRGIYHKMGLKSAYAHIGELPMTNYTPGYEGAIDYIWYTTSTLAVTELLGEVDKQYLSRVVGFPNAHFPSDHIPVCAKFMFKPPPKDSSNSYRR